MSMYMKEYQLSLPENLKIKDLDLKMMVSAMLFKSGRLSSGQAAKIVGISKRTFIEILGNYNTSVFDYDNDNELLEDIANA